MCIVTPTLEYFRYLHMTRQNDFVLLAPFEVPRYFIPIFQKIHVWVKWSKDSRSFFEHSWLNRLEVQLSQAWLWAIKLCGFGY